MSGNTRQLNRNPLRANRPVSQSSTRQHRTAPFETNTAIPVSLVFQIAGTSTEVSVPVRSTLVLGRQDRHYQLQPDLDLAPFDGYRLGVSRQHSMIWVQDERLVIRDLGTANGTFLNGHRLLPGQEYALNNGDELILGALSLRVSFVTADEYARV